MEGVGLDAGMPGTGWTPDVEDYSTTGDSGNRTTQTQPASGGAGLLPDNIGNSLQHIGAVMLALVATAPLVLSSAHLYDWGRNEKGGLGLPIGLAWVPILALDAAAIVCIYVVTAAAMRGKTANKHHWTAWMIALGSAAANLAYGRSTKADYDEWAFPFFSLLGPFMVDITLALMRDWFLTETEQRRESAKMRDFGLNRWMPWVSPRETFLAWQIAQREGIKNVGEAIARARETAMLRWMPKPDALRWAFDAIGGRDAYAARAWLLSRGIRITQGDVEEALRPRDLIEFVAAAEDGVTAVEVAQWKYGRAEADDVERARRLLDELVGEQLTRDSTGKGGRGKPTRWRIATDDATEAVA